MSGALAHEWRIGARGQFGGVHPRSDVFVVDSLVGGAGDHAVALDRPRRMGCLRDLRLDAGSRERDRMQVEALERDKDAE